MLHSRVRGECTHLNARVALLVALSLTLVTVSCAGEDSPETVSPQLVLERAKESFASLSFYRTEYYSKTAKYYRGVLEETEIEATVDFQAPDRKHTIGRISVSDASGMTNSSFEEFWIGRTQYLRQGEEGHWIAVIVPASNLPEQENALDVILNSPELIESLELDIETLGDSEEVFKVSLMVEPGHALGFQESDRNRQLIHWISLDDYRVRRITYSSETPRPGEETQITYTLSEFGVPIEIEPPTVTPVPLSAQ